MNPLRHLLIFGTALATVAVLTASAGASRNRDWSEPLNLGPAINTEYEEAGPAIARDGRALYFQSTRPGGIGNCDLWVAQRPRVQQDWDSPENLGSVINTETCENSVSLSHDEHSLFFTRPPGDIWVSYRRDVRDHFGWESPVRLGPAINLDTASESTARHFVSERHGISQLYFFSTRPGGPGGPDIYVADSFGAPRLVAELSSPDIDGATALSRNGLEVFFHSTRPGIGGRDLWTSRRRTVYDSWAPPENIGEVLNTASEELFPALSADDEELYFTSSRPTGFGLNDIYVTTRGLQGGR
jgi:hypothetical protein